MLQPTNSDPNNIYEGFLDTIFSLVTVLVLLGISIVTFVWGTINYNKIDKCDEITDYLIVAGVLNFFGLLSFLRFYVRNACCDDLICCSNILLRCLNVLLLCPFVASLLACYIFFTIDDGCRDMLVNHFEELWGILLFEFALFWVYIVVFFCIAAKYTK